MSSSAARRASGWRIATAFRDAGAIVHATGATDAEVAAAGDIAGIAFSRLDVRDAAAIADYAEGFGPVAALVDCAGVNLRAAEFTLEGFETAIDINLNGVMRIALAFRAKTARRRAARHRLDVFVLRRAPCAGLCREQGRRRAVW